MRMRGMLAVTGALAIFLGMGGCPPVPGDGDPNNGNGSTDNVNGGFNSNSGGGGGNSNTGGGAGNSNSGGGSSNTNGAGGGSSNGNTNGTGGGSTNGNTNGSGGGSSNSNVNGGGSANTNSNSGGGSSNANDNGPPLNNTQTNVVHDVALAMEDAGRVYNAFHAIVSGLIDFESLGVIACIPGCPLVSYVSSNTSAAFQIAYCENQPNQCVCSSASNPPPGCTAAFTDGQTYRGQIAISPYNRTTRVGTVEFGESGAPFTIGGNVVTGTAALTITAGGTNPLNISGNLPFTYGASEEFSGAVAIQMDISRRIDLSAAVFNIEREGRTYTVELEDLVINAAANSSFMPSAGKIFFTTGGVDYVITFTAQSPSTRQVIVNINNGGDSTSTIP